jgi:PHD/YefM family antitoxin component YafN of YafNO toxin-antitoxin module
MGSDHDVVYHLFGKPYTFDKEVKTVEVVKIDALEYDRLQTQFMLQKQENEAMKSEIRSLKAQLSS